LKIVDCDFAFIAKLSIVNMYGRNHWELYCSKMRLQRSPNSADLGPL